jgi:GR25 family glycosyltransferase involved in LPS biosynthesis
VHTIKSDSENATSKRPVPGIEQTLPEDWSFFDKIYCISLENREDRRHEAMMQFSRVGLTEKVEFIIVKKHPTDCEQGIYESHMHCLGKGLKSGAENILVFEDDIIFERFSPERLKNAIHFLRGNSDWQVLFFGSMMKKCQRTENPSVVRIGYRSLTHAYAVPRRFAETLVMLHPWNNVAYDDFLRDLNSPWMYAVYPSFAFQSNALSDNDPYLFLDRFRRLCGGLRSIQKRNEIYHHNKWLIIGCHILALLAIAFWL